MFYGKVIELSKNINDVTAQHELFHALFSLVDSKTKNQLLAEVMVYLKTDNKFIAEEWLAESFGIYTRR
jgi:hypothetical protein